MLSPRPSLPAGTAGSLWTEFAPVMGPLPADVMACISFGSAAVQADDPRHIQVGLTQLGGTRCELWRSTRPVRSGRDGGIGFAEDGEVLIGHLNLLECELDEIAAATFKAYARIIAFLERQDYPCLLRCWNFLHQINRGDADRERYKQFCVGRYQALAAAPGFERQLPAGTAIGMAEPGLVIYFLAARQPGVQVENPRQTPAFHYPRQYGPRSPSFSRATLRTGNGTAELLVSGTASVIGHATQHPGDTVAQLDETLANLRALLQHAAATHLGRSDPACWIAQNLKLYLRNRRDYEWARAKLEPALGGSVLYLEGDICRHDLQIEIEGVFAAAPA